MFPPTVSAAVGRSLSTGSPERMAGDLASACSALWLEQCRARPTCSYAGGCRAGHRPTPDADIELFIEAVFVGRVDPKTTQGSCRRFLCANDVNERVARSSGPITRFRENLYLLELTGRARVAKWRA